jgi:AAA+ ATPase superfamily predicted ATPase
MPLAKLVDREVEKGELEAAWVKAAAGDPQLVMLWGRRRVGKTFLLAHVVQRKRAVFFGATEQAEAVELARLVEAIGRDLGSRAADLAGGGFPSWEAAFRFMGALAADEPLLVVLDEVPYLTRSTKGFASVVQAFWDHLPVGTKLMFALTGSAVGTMESMLGPGAALRGRPTVTLRLDPLDLVTARLFLPKLRSENLLEAYAACGGYPLHLREWDQDVDVETNLLNLAFSPGGILLEDAAGILREELPDVGGYPRILAAIGRGRTRPSEIAAEADQRIERPLDILVKIGFARRALPLGAPRRARPVYELADSYLAFWFGVLYSDLQQIEGGQGPAVLRRRQPQWQRHVGWLFEESARAHAIRMVRRRDLPQDMVIGRWWASSGEPCEVDVLGMRESRSQLLGEARWQSRPLGLSDLRTLIRKAARVPSPVDDPLFALWGRGGVDRAVHRAGAMGFDVDDVLT